MISLCVDTAIQLAERRCSSMGGVLHIPKKLYASSLALACSPAHNRGPGIPSSLLRLQVLPDVFQHRPWAVLQQIIHLHAKPLSPSVHTKWKLSCHVLPTLSLPLINNSRGINNKRSHKPARGQVCGRGPLSAWAQHGPQTWS